MFTFFEGAAANWHVWVVTIILVVAAVIDGIKLKVPNWITFPMIVAGWIYSGWAAESLGMTWYQGVGWSFFGTFVGLALLLPAYAIGGMGAGDVKLLAGVGAWMHATVTVYAFVVSAVVGAILAVAMVLYRRAWAKHRGQFWMILNGVSNGLLDFSSAGVAVPRSVRVQSSLTGGAICVTMETLNHGGWRGALFNA